MFGFRLSDKKGGVLYPTARQAKKEKSYPLECCYQEPKTENRGKKVAVVRLKDHGPK